ncbi:MAG TPA: acyl carrier protein [Pyrinomonadaceae bacterium]
MSLQSIQQVGADISGAEQNNGNSSGSQQKPQTVEEIQRWLARELAAFLEIDADEIDIQEPFANFGLNSIAAVTLSGDLEDWLGCELPATLLWDYPTIQVLSRHLAEEVLAAK